MAPYAKNTSVSSEASVMEIQRILMRYGATGFQYGYEERQAGVAFKLNGRMIKMIMELPDPDDEAFKRTPARRQWRDADGAYRAWEQECRRRWRALALVLKAKLEAMETGIETLEEAFMAHIVSPTTGKTFGQMFLPKLTEILRLGELPKLLPGGGDDADHRG